MTILACDPGYDRLGVAIVAGTVHSPSLVFSTCLSSSKDQSHAYRIGELAQGISAIIEEHQPDVLATETLFFARNTSTALKVAEVRGMLCTLAAQTNLDVIEHSPQEIKMAVTGYGNANKNEVITMTKRLVPNAPAKARDDEYDAIALGICALASYRK